jgi:hypothetical protein
VASRRKKTIAGITSTPAEKRRDNPKPKIDPEEVALKKQMAKDSAGWKKFRKDLAAERKLQEEMGVIRNTRRHLQPGGAEAKDDLLDLGEAIKDKEFWDKNNPRARKQREVKRFQKRYQMSRTKTAPAKKPRKK